ncbi:MAG: PfkB family carbohydrate kinase, partial [Pseudomonadota bacterium]
GYMATPEQARSVASMVSRIRERNANVLHICDPVIGDAGGLYVPEDTAAAIRDALVPMCDVATPNRFELAWLLNETASETISDAVEQAGKLGPAQVLVTSVTDREDGLTGNLLTGNGSVHVTRHPSIPNPPNGPGDLTAATFLAHMLDGISAQENLALTTASVFEILQSSARRNSDELTLERDVASLLKAEAEVECYSPGGNP